MTPTPGMLEYEDIQFQLVEIPPIVEGSSDGKSDGFMNLSSIRNADGILIIVDLSVDPSGDYLMVAQELENSRIITSPPQGEVEIQRRGYGREIQFIWEGELVDCSSEDVITLLNEFRIRSALVRVRGKVTLDVVEDAIFGNAVYKPTIVVGNKMDLGVNEGTIEQLKQVASPLKVLLISTKETENLDKVIGSEFFKLLEIVRVYTKEPGSDPAKIPIVSQGKLTVGELAKIIHNDFYNRFKYARIWGPSAKFPNERVGIDRVLDDGTIIQLYI
jgi:ribosome-interacting GTPase 1